MLITICFIIVILINVYYIVLIKYNFNKMQEIVLQCSKNQLEIVLHIQIMINQIKELEKGKK